MRIDLTGQTILVTGASRGIGAEIARQLAGAGATVAVHYSASSEEAVALCQEIGNGAEAFRADLSDASEADRLVRDVIGAYGSLHCVVNNAGEAIHSPL
ncbi:MAG: SDR family NAD(P)-dependent oxidoreductase, partial [Bacteroidetes bacterium]|nr:SDR family NAD(P)-dependent oxidoreductase [Bacteroidota bacterium]